MTNGKCARRRSTTLGRVTVRSGQVRLTTADVRYASPDGRAFVFVIDSCTKYPDVSFGLDDGVLKVALFASERTLRHDRRYKRATQVEVRLPEVEGEWRLGESRARYGTEIVAVCVPS